LTRSIKRVHAAKYQTNPALASVAEIGMTELSDVFRIVSPGETEVAAPSPAHFRESPCPLASFIAALAYVERNPINRECLLMIACAAPRFYWPGP